MLWLGAAAGRPALHLSLSRAVLLTAPATSPRRPSSSSSFFAVIGAQLDSKNLCAVQSVERSHGREHVVIATLNRLANGTVLNAAAQHRGPGKIRPGGPRGRSQGQPWGQPQGGGGGSEDDGTDDDAGGGVSDTGVVRSLVLACHGPEDRRALYAALLNSTSPVLPTVTLAARSSHPPPMCAVARVWSTVEHNCLRAGGRGRAGWSAGA